MSENAKIEQEPKATNDKVSQGETTAATAEVPASKPEEKQVKPTEGNAPKPTEGNAPKPAEDNAPKDGAPVDSAPTCKVAKGKAPKGKPSKDTAPTSQKKKDAQFDQEIETAGSGASLTFPMQCSALRIGGHVVIKGQPCKIIDMTTSKTGKHGHAKVSLTGTNIFTAKKLEDMSPSTHNMDVPNIKRDEYTLINVDDGFLTFMKADGDTKEDVKVPEGELGEKLVEDFEAGKDLLVTVLSAMGIEAAISYKEAPKGNDK
ncbi:translation initiation factor eIF5A [Coemansia spiralis]|uniref:Translation initiation factor eIF5A n=1 Tax=Coemansia spiralis TaxID=417178 RepID=A0A9W8GK36_9FUNG|nr:translation initiation factor eIF5A [Coemansia spiralis]